MDKIRVVLADDHGEVIEKIRGILGDEFEVVATAENGSQAVDAVLALDPDVLVIDISMPLLSRLQAARNELAFRSIANRKARERLDDLSV